MAAFDLDPHDHATVCAILRRHVPNIEVRVFGSRRKGTARKTSDLDLVLMTERPLDLLCMADLREAFSDSDLPFKIDLIDWAVTAPSFRRIIERDSTLFDPPKA